MVWGREERELTWGVGSAFGHTCVPPHLTGSRLLSAVFHIPLPSCLTLLVAPWHFFSSFPSFRPFLPQFLHLFHFTSYYPANRVWRVLSSNSFMFLSLLCFIHSLVMYHIFGRTGTCQNVWMVYLGDADMYGRHTQTQGESSKGVPSKEVTT